MAFYYGINSDYASSFFNASTSNSNSNSLGALSSILSDYSSIRNGSYSKLLQKYYSLDESEQKATTGSTSISRDEAKTLVSISESTDELKESADKLFSAGTGSVFAKEEVKGEYGYNKDKIYSAVKDFVDDYNAVLDMTEKSNTKSIASNSSAMIHTTLANEDMLEEVGISIDSAGKLTVDEKTFKDADMSKVKTLFQGTGSYAYQMSAKASMINFNAETEMNRSNTYTNNGTYSYNYASGNLVDYMF